MIEEKNLPLVSIVVPCYNHEKYVKETIESIINQTYKNIELIVIDDGSKDNSVQVIQELADKYGFTFIHRPNKGLSATLNEGIKLSKGKYFSAIASDDILMLEKIEKQVEFMESNPEYGMCYGKIVYFEDSIENTFEYPNSNRQGWVFDDLLNYGCFIPAPSTFMKKEAFDTVGGYDENLWIEDWDMWLRIAQKYQVGYIDEYLAYYRKHDTNISSQSLKMYKAEKQILEKYKDYENFDNVIKNKKIVWFSLLSRKYKKEAMNYFMHSIKYLLVDVRVLKALIKLVFFR
ncbi:MAG TPA: glycosyltransferase [Aliarcobacter thereius]|nr:glycosyltransferase [Aliarcobacter thereius]HJE03286.1 glycosyltransferase [Aliarcobacter thereius]